MARNWMDDPNLTPFNSTLVGYICEGCAQHNMYRYPDGLKRLPKVRCSWCKHRQRPPRKRRRPVTAPHSAHPVTGHPFPGEQPKLVPSRFFSELGLYAGVCLAVLLVWLSPFRLVFIEAVKNLEHHHQGKVQDTKTQQ